MNVPVLRFPEFEGELVQRKIGDFAVVKTGSRDTQDRIDGGKYPFFVRSDTIERINSIGFDGEAILTSGDGVGVGKNIHYIDGKFDYHQRVYAIRNFRDGIDGQFFFQFFRENFLKRVMRLSAKNSVDSVRMSMITDMMVATPSLAEQKKIAAFLGAVDAKIAALRMRVAGLERYKRGLMQALFSQTLRFTKPDGSAFPDWEEKKLGDLLTVRYGKDHKGLPDGEIPVLGTGGIMRWVDRSLHDGPSVLIGRKGTIDKPRYVEQPFWTVDTLFYSDIKAEYLPFFAFLVVQSINWLKYNEATGVPSLSAAAIHSVKVTVPVNPDEQTKIAEALSAIDAKIAAVTAQLDQVQDFKKGLLQQMFV